MEALNHAIRLNEQIHAQLVLLATQRYDSLNGSPADVARRLVADAESVNADLRAVRHGVTQAWAAAKRIDRIIGGIGGGEKCPDGPKTFSIITCETISPPPHVRPPEAGFVDGSDGGEGGAGGFGTFDSIGASQFVPKRESDRPKQQAGTGMGKKHPDLR